MAESKSSRKSLVFIRGVLLKRRAGVRQLPERQQHCNPDDASRHRFLVPASAWSGNSGSPLFSLDGEVIGIVSNIMSASGGSEGLAFAATSNTARRLLLEQKRFWSGIAGFLVDGDLAKALNLPQPAGVLVQQVAEGSIAWRWGIHAGTVRANVEGEGLVLGGDILLSVNDVAVAEGGGNYDDIYASINKLRPGDNLVIKIFRQGQIVKLSIPVAP